MTENKNIGKTSGDPVTIRGVVSKEVFCYNESSRYMICSGEREYAIISNGRQAVKDNLFVRKGQRMEIEGTTLPGEPDNKVFSQKSKIILTTKEKDER